jgi:2,3-diphosphopglycerate-independent phosphoglycerate mutase
MAVSAVMSQILKAHAINAQRLLNGKLPANIVLLRGAAMKAATPSFLQMHGLRSAMVAPTCIIRGLGKTLGMDILESEGGTGDYRSNIANKAHVILEALPRYEFLVLHVKGVDDAGHDKNLDMKTEMLARAGDALGILWNGIPAGTTVAVVGDHSTPVVIGDHSCEPVPVSIARKEENDESCALKDSVSVLSEIECSSGWLGRFNGLHLIQTMKAVHFS